MQALDINKSSTEGQALLDTFSRNLVGQREGAQTLIDIVEMYQMGMQDPSKPAGNALFLGPTGSGKTFTVELMAQALFGDERACIKIDCAEYQHGHEIAKLVGSPPGYLGHRETHPMLTQEALNQWHTEKLKLSILFFDEIEKASDTLWQLLLGILDKATCTLGDNRRVDFSKTLIVMTSNLGARQMTEVTDGGMGFYIQAMQEGLLDSQLDTIAKEAAKRKFTPEFFNRLDHIVVYKSFSEGDMVEIMDKELGKIQQRFIKTPDKGLLFSLDKAAREKLLFDARDFRKYGARTLKRAIQNRVLMPLVRLLASGQIADRDTVRIKEEGGEHFNFYKDNA